jgi:hypothetical protein
VWVLVMTPFSDLMRGYQAFVETWCLHFQEKNLYKTQYEFCCQNLITDIKYVVHRTFTVKRNHYVSVVNNAYKYI